MSTINGTRWVMAKSLNMDHLGARTKHPSTGVDVFIAAITHRSQRGKGRRVLLKLLNKRTGESRLYVFKPNDLVQINTEVEFK